VPAIVFFNKSLISKILIIIFSLFFFVTNIYFGKNVINKYNKTEFKNLSTAIKIISPKIKINRFFQNEETNIISELIKLSSPEDEKETLFIFPEGILTNIYLEDLSIYKKTFEENFSKKHKILLGINSQTDLKIYNSLAVVDNNLNILGKYNKNKLVPFGEFLPLENILSAIGLKKITQGYQSYSSDEYRKILQINNIKILPLICYEIIYSGKLNKSGQQFNFIVNISEDGWFGNSIGPFQHFSHSIFRSIEEGKNLIRSANNGISAYINPKGQIIKKIESTGKGVLEINSFKETSETFFSKNGNKIFFYFLLFYIILIFFLKKIEK
jgi:apolipoprotein N-acyltransferase